MTPEHERLVDLFQNVEKWHISSVDLEAAATAITALSEENERLRVALRWYASREAWTTEQVEGGNGDYGTRARAALGEKQ